MDSITLNGIEYIKADQVPSIAPSGNRAIVVIDRGWIFAGDVLRENGRIKLSRCVWIFKWEACGFGAVVQDPSKADIRRHADVDIPDGAEIFSVPVCDDWGIK